eukprot:c16139_g1_i1.p1 GENE.c16139_g1_i1~~c16139_g1_i1.p1  ORF type:complete len:165 (+),score=64.47 c16139_g1_i1:68-562(+)
MATPVAKIFAVFVRQISRPIANRVKHAAASKESYNTALARFGKLSFRFENKLNAFLMGSKAPTSVPSKKDSIERGAEVVGETFIFVVAVGVTITEFTWSKNRAARKEAEKESRIYQQLDKTQESIKSVTTIVESLNKELINLRTQVEQFRNENQELKLKLEKKK